MKPELLIHPLPEAVSPSDLAGGVVIVIDILRATTVIVHALANGARAVVPVSSIDEARTVSLRWPVGQCLLGGERHGIRIEGFDLDNSPANYSSDRVAGRTIVFTTTNGTRALHWAKEASEIWIGAFSNLSTVVKRLRDEPRPVHLLCAGTDRRISAEDLLFAGAVADGCSETRTINREPRIFQEFWQTHGRDDQCRRQTLQESAGGRNLMDLGFDRDIERASQVDLFAIVPRWNAETGELTSQV